MNTPTTHTQSIIPSANNHTLRLTSEPSKPVYRVLSEHQLAELGWEQQALVSELHRWRELFTSEFKLKLSPTALRIGGARSNYHGHFRPGHNDFGLAREIAFNQRDLLNRLTAGDFWRVLGTLLHELLHAWQYDHGKPSPWNYHNSEFRAKAMSLGLIVSTRGVTDYSAESPFFDLIKEYGVIVPELPSAEVSRPSGNSTLKKWSCGCTNVRVAIADFRAQCLKCNNQFRRAD